MAARDIEETGPILIPDLLAIAFIVVWGLAWLAPGLDHPLIHNWDESFHQVVARGTLANFPVPTMYADPVVPLDPSHWWYAGVWMHKAPAVFWWAAAVMKVIGITPVALRTASLLSQLGIGVLIYLLSRPLAGRAIALTAALAYLVLPWGWFMTQGNFVSDVTDISLTLCVTLAIAWLWWAVEKDSLALAAAAGAAIGAGYLCKTFLALAPLGVAATWWLLARLKLCKGPTLTQLALVFGAFAIVAVPWNLYAYLKWPDVYLRAVNLTLGLASESSDETKFGWRPADAIFHEINYTILQPLPYTLTALCGVWLAVKAARERDGRLIAIALWLWSTWLVHSFSAVKGHGHLWNCVPAVFIAYAVTIRDTLRSRGLATAVFGSVLVYAWKPQLNWLIAVRHAMPEKWEQLRTWEESNFVEQVFFVGPAVFLAWYLLHDARDKKLLKRVTVALGTLATLGTAAYALPLNIRDDVKQQKAIDRHLHWSSSQDLGIVLEKALDPKSVLFMDTSLDYERTFEYLNLMFWSGRMCYRQKPDLPLAESKGYHPYLISPAAEAYAPVEGVPPYAGLRAYDLLKPAPAAPVPAGLTPLDQQLKDVTAIGWAARPLDKRWSRYAFYFSPHGTPADMKVTYAFDDGSSADFRLDVTASLRRPEELASATWFLIPAVGPAHEHVKAITFAPWQ